MTPAARPPLGGCQLCRTRMYAPRRAAPTGAPIALP